MRSLFTLALSALIIGCVSNPRPHQTGTSGAHRFLALGDSYTIGESVGESERWPEQLAARLRADGIEVAAPEIIARTGWTTDELAAAIAAQKPEGPYDLVTLLIGVNNQYRGRSVDEYRTQFRELLQTAARFAGSAARVVVVSIPDWGVTPFAAEHGRDAGVVGREIDAFNAVAQQETTSAGAVWIDITPGSRAAGHDRTLLAADGLHPSGVMYRQWVDAIEPAAREILAHNRR